MKPDNTIEALIDDLVPAHRQDNFRKAIAQEANKAYRKGYNDNARDCNCDKFSVKPHQHLMDDGTSRNIRPILTADKEQADG